MRYLNYFLFWLLLIPIAVGNGAFRQLFILPRTSELTAHQISCFTGILLFAVYNYYLVKHWKGFPANPWPMAFIWVVLTILFEFGLGRATGKPWTILFHDYNIFAGRLWVLVLIWTGLAPVVMAKLFRH
jgi:hypothetical protein